MIIAIQTLIFFRESLLRVLHRLLEPAYKRFALTLARPVESDEEDEEVSAEYDDEKGVVFYPPMYAQRYAAVTDCLMDERWNGMLHKVVDLGYHDMSFIKYLKDIPGIKNILGVDLETVPLRCSSDLLCEDYAPIREDPLQITLFQGNAADPDYRLIGCDAVIAIEMIEHMLPQDLDRLVHTIFGFIKPWVVVITTPNGDFNVLFKSLERNGMRRLDHFFEWSREQFNDWCSNIVSRYPNFTVTCKGIGPGPEGTSHLGCCSQLALFVNNNYQKQKDLNIDSLALVRRSQSPETIALVHGWDSPCSEDSEYIRPSDECLAQLNEIIYSAKQSCMTIVITPTFSVETLQYRDNTSQCDLDVEFNRNYLMFDYEDMCFSMVKPRRKFEDNRVYMIEDVASRLNCTTLQVKKFSKTTQNLMAKNKMDSLMYTRDVVDEIRNLTNMLNFNKDDTVMKKNGYIWYNINWGTNAPYWNQYYKVVRSYSYPYETKSEDSRILDVVTEELARLSDMHYIENTSMANSTLKMPMDRLMETVSHITDDKDKVKDLLEWNGYEIINDELVHDIVIIDKLSEDSNFEEWPGFETAPDFETSEAYSTSNSDRTSVPDYHGIALRRALDSKVKKLKSMQSANADISDLLERAVCRLMKLALHSFKTCQAPPPTRWMQYKLFDLLTLTERAIARRNKYVMEKLALGAVDLEELEQEKQRKLARKMIEDENPKVILDNYSLPSTIEMEQSNSHETTLKSDLQTFMDDRFFSKNYDDQIFKGDGPRIIQDTIEGGKKYEMVAFQCSKERATLRTSDFYTSTVKYKCKKIRARISKDRLLYEKDSSHKENKNLKRMKTTSSTMTNSRKLHKTKAVFDEYGKIRLRSKEHKKLQSTSSKPIPGSIIELCHPELVNLKNDGLSLEKALYKSWQNDPISATQTCQFIEIVSEAGREIISMQRTVGTNPEKHDLDEDIETVVNVTKTDSPENCLQNITIDDPPFFLNDINEPSTSKGVRHVNMDVQCSPMATTHMLSPATSFTKLPDMLSMSLKIGDSLNNLTNTKNLSFGHSLGFDEKCMEIVNQRLTTDHTYTANVSNGIKIKDSTLNLVSHRQDCGIYNYGNYIGSISPIIKSPSTPEICETCLSERRSRSNTDLSYNEVICTVINGNRVYDFPTNTTNKLYSKPLFIKDSTTKISMVDEKDDEKLMPQNNQTTEETEMRTFINTLNNVSIRNETFINRYFQVENAISQTSNQTLQNKASASTSANAVTESNAFVEDQKSSHSCPEDVNLRETSSNHAQKFDKCVNFTASSYSSKQNCESDCENKLSRNMSDFGSNNNGSSIKSNKNIDTVEDVTEKDHCKTLKIKFRPPEDQESSKLCTKQCKLDNAKALKKDIKITSKKDNKAIVKVDPKYIAKKDNKIGIKKESKIIAKKVIKNSSKKDLRPPELPKTQLKSEKVATVRNSKFNSEKRETNNTKNVKLTTTMKGTNNISNKPSKTIVKVTSKILMSTGRNPNPRYTIVRSRPSKQNISSRERTKIQIKDKTYLPAYLIRLRKAGKRAKEELENDSLCKFNSKTSIINSKNTMESLNQEGRLDVSKLTEPVTDIVYHHENDGTKKNISLEIVDKQCVSNNISSDSKNISSNNNLETPQEVSHDLNKLTKSVTDTSVVVSHNENDDTKNPSPDVVDKTCKANNISSDISTKNSMEKPNVLIGLSRLLKPDIGIVGFNENNDTNKLSPDAVERKCVAVEPDESNKCNPSDISKISSKEKSVAKDFKGSQDNNSTPNTNNPNCKIKKQVKENKENILNYPNKLIANSLLQNLGNSITDTQQNVFMAHLPKNSLPVTSISKSKPNTSNVTNIIVPAMASTDETKNSSSEGCTSSNNNKENTKFTNCNAIVYEVLNDVLQTSCHNVASQNAESKKYIDEETVIIIQGDDASVNERKSRTNLNISEMDNLRLDETSSLVSFKTVITNEDSLSYADMEDALNCSFEVSSADESPLSFYETTEAQPNNSKVLNLTACENTIHEPPQAHDTNTSQAHDTNSVKNIFERNTLQLTQNPPGVLASQVISGFSVQESFVGGDHTEFIRLVDSETGSFTIVERIRQATSEEIYISGREDSDQFSVIEDDVIFPDWLFNILSHQQSIVGDDRSTIDVDPLPMTIQDPVGEPLLDVNGNAIETNVGAGAGAGDGHGIHSDNSWDSHSSDEGSSLSSSSATSSRQQSESTLIGPTLPAQYDLLLEGIPEIIVTTTSSRYQTVNRPYTETTVSEADSTRAEGGTSHHHRSHTVASDVEADVSSLDTDVPSDDN